MAEKISFVFYFDWMKSIDSLNMPAEAKLEVIRAMVDYSESGVVPRFDDKVLDATFSFIWPQLSRDRMRWEETCRKRKEAIEKRWARVKGEQGSDV